MISFVCEMVGSFVVCLGLWSIELVCKDRRTSTLVEDRKWVSTLSDHLLFWMSTFVKLYFCPI